MPANKAKQEQKSFEETARLYADGIEKDAELGHKLAAQIAEGYDRPPLALKNLIELLSGIKKQARIIKK